MEEAEVIFGTSYGRATLVTLVLPLSFLIMLYETAIPCISATILIGNNNKYTINLKFLYLLQICQKVMIQDYLSYFIKYKINNHDALIN